LERKKSTHAQPPFLLKENVFANVDLSLGEREGCLGEEKEVGKRLCWDL